jgi:CMP-N,N'-diacetyllegionaminic acid synthase
MIKEYNYIALIPARSGSQGVKHKNIMKFNNKPLIQYVAELAEKAKYIDGIFFSSDSQDYLNIYKSFNLTKDITNNYLRSPKLSTHTSLSSDYIKEFVSTLKDRNIKVNNIIILQPTNPLSTVDDINKAILKHSENNNILISIAKPIQHIPDILVINKNLKNYKYLIDYKGTRRQDYENDYYVINGNLFIGNTNLIMENIKKEIEDIFLIKDKTEFFLQESYKSFQIDEPEDIFILDSILKNLK